MATNILLICLFTLYLAGVYDVLIRPTDVFNQVRAKGFTNGQIRLALFMSGTLGAPIFVWWGLSAIRFQLWIMYVKFIITQCIRIVRNYPDIVKKYTPNEQQDLDS